MVPAPWPVHSVLRFPYGRSEAAVRCSGGGGGGGSTELATRRTARCQYWSRSVPPSQDQSQESVSPARLVPTPPHYLIHSPASQFLLLLLLPLTRRRRLLLLWWRRWISCTERLSCPACGEVEAGFLWRDGRLIFFNWFVVDGSVVFVTCPSNGLVPTKQKQLVHFLVVGKENWLTNCYYNLCI